MSTDFLLGQGGSSLIPIGLICMWSGFSSNIPSGWALCNGSNNTPDLRDKFVLGAGKNYSVGVIGGEKEVILTIAQISSHSHDIGNHTHDIVQYSDYRNGTNGISLEYVSRYAGFVKTLPGLEAGSISGDTTTSTVGGGQPHDNMPPYYALCFIMKL